MLREDGALDKWRMVSYGSEVVTMDRNSVLASSIASRLLRDGLADNELTPLARNICSHLEMDSKTFKNRFFVHSGGFSYLRDNTEWEWKPQARKFALAYKVTDSSGNIRQHSRIRVSPETSDGIMITYYIDPLALKPKPVYVRWGVYTDNDTKYVGKTVKDAFRALWELWRIPSDVKVMVNGAPISSMFYVLRPGDSLEFYRKKL